MVLLVRCPSPATCRRGRPPSASALADAALADDALADAALADAALADAALADAALTDADATLAADALADAALADAVAHTAPPLRRNMAAGPRTHPIYRPASPKQMIEHSPRHPYP
jgi:hypothetical protein